MGKYYLKHCLFARYIDPLWTNMTGNLVKAQIACYDARIIK